MPLQFDLTEQVASATRKFAESLDSGGKVVADMSSVVAITSQLPLSNREYWERLIRSEFYSALQSSSPPRWKIWSKPSNLLTWVDIISWDGYRRERTLRTLNGAVPNSFFCALAF